MTESNGKQVHASWLRIDMDMLTHACQVSGEAPSTDTFLAMLAQATRELEAQQRMERMKQIQAEAIINAENERIKAQIRGKV